MVISGKDDQVVKAREPPKVIQTLALEILRTLRVLIIHL